MKISFDLDDTLIPSNSLVFETEKRSLLQRTLKIELIRLGAPDLIKQLQKEYQVGIYTTSYRSVFRIRFHLMTYGIFPDFVINEKRNRDILKSMNIYSSKYPPAFDIKLHIDDSEGVSMEGRRHNFQTVIIDTADKSWKDKILNYLKP